MHLSGLGGGELDDRLDHGDRRRQYPRTRRSCRWACEATDGGRYVGFGLVGRLGPVLDAYREMLRGLV